MNHDGVPACGLWSLVIINSVNGASFARGDVSVASTTEQGLEGVFAAARKVDILVNNAGFVRKSTSVLEFDPGEWRRSIEINLVIFYEVCCYVVPVMKRAGYGRVVGRGSRPIRV
jgi:NAD(P)-dependent dehydrogenase (short-subunit alcohol dehydrogenase family)